MAQVYRTTVYFPPELHHDLKQVALDRGTNLSELLRAAAEIVYSADLNRVRTDPVRAERIENIGKSRRVWSERYKRRRLSP